MRRLLIVAYYFPPLGGIGSVRVNSFANQLSQFGWETMVLAPRNGAYYRDPALDFPEERVIRSGSLEISRVTKRVLHAGGDDIRPAAPTGIRGRLRRVARKYLYYPDAQVGWYLPALKTGRSALRSHKFDAIFSSAYPVTAHLIARRLHRASGLPWVAEYRDPFSELIAGDAVGQRRALRLERAIADDAAALVMTSPSWASGHAARWEKPVTVITNGCDGPISAEPAPGQFILSHLGSMFPDRQDLRAAWHAVRNLLEEQQVDKVRFIGDIQPEVRSELDQWGLDGIVEETGFLSRPDANRALAASSALLLAGPKDARPLLQGWIPAKLFEYLATDLPIIYIGNSESDAAALLRRHPGCHVLEPGDVGGVTQALLDARDQRYKRDLTSFTRTSLTGELAAVLDRVANHRGSA
jgi:glycosyltransferase involved in cell wall biosynthesis